MPFKLLDSSYRPPRDEQGLPSKPEEEKPEESSEESIMGMLLRNVANIGGKGAKKALDIPTMLIEAGKSSREASEKLIRQNTPEKYLSPYQKGEENLDPTGDFLKMILSPFSGEKIEEKTRGLREKILPKDYDIPKSKTEEKVQEIGSDIVADVPLLGFGPIAKALKVGGGATKLLKPLYNAASTSTGYHLASNMAEYMGLGKVGQFASGVLGSMGVRGWASLAKKGMMLGNKSLNALETKAYNASTKSPLYKDTVLKVDQKALTQANRMYDRQLPFLRDKGHEHLGRTVEKQMIDIEKKFNKGSMTIEAIADQRKILNETMNNSLVGNSAIVTDLRAEYKKLVQPFRDSLDNFGKVNAGFGKQYELAKHLTAVTNTKSYLASFLKDNKTIGTILSPLPEKVIKAVLTTGEATIGGLIGHSVAGKPGAVLGGMAGAGVEKGQVFVRQALNSPVVRARLADVFISASKHTPKSMLSALRKFNTAVEAEQKETPSRSRRKRPSMDEQERIPRRVSKHTIKLFND